VDVVSDPAPLKVGFPFGAFKSAPYPNEDALKYVITATPQKTTMNNGIHLFLKI